MGRRRALVLTGGLAALLCVVAARPAYAAGSAYADWALTGGAGSATVPVTGFPDATFATDATSATTSGGTNTYLGAGTPFGAVFGSSRGEPYVVVRPATGGTPSTTTITFATPVPASSWGFTLGDIDAETVRVTATDAAGHPVDAAGLGYQGAFNYCAATPKPQACGTAPSDDQPNWDEGTTTLRGNGPDTSGSSGWFRPTVAISTLTLRMTVLTGRPVYQLWLAALSRSVSGNLTGGCDGQAAAGKVHLLDADGNVVAETTADEDGAYTFASVVPQHYRVHVAPDSGLDVDGPDTATADPTRADVSDVDFALTCPDETTTTATTTVSPPPTTTPGAAGRPAPTLPNTGTPVGQWLGVGALLVAAGGGLLWFGVRRRRAG